MTAKFDELREPEPPLASIEGSSIDEVFGLYDRQGFEVEVIDVSGPSAPVTADLRPNRIRLLVGADRIVKRASLG